MNERTQQQINQDALIHLIEDLDSEDRRVFFSALLWLLAGDIKEESWRAACQVAYEVTTRGDIPVGW